jgi:hypothetical protein
MEGLALSMQSKINEDHTTQERLREACAHQLRFSRVRAQMVKLLKMVKLLIENGKTIKNGKTKLKMVKLFSKW